MNLDDLSVFQQIDQSNLIVHIDGLPDQLQQAVQWGRQQSIPVWPGLKQVVLAGTGSPALGAELLAGWARRRCLTPVFVERNIELPAWAGGPGVLVVVCAHSGEEPEALAQFAQAVERQCRCLTLTTGGKLANLAGQAGSPAWIYPHTGPEMTGTGWFFGLPLAALVQLGILEDPGQELEIAITDLRRQQERLRVDIPVVQNPAKRLAGQLVDRLVTIIGADELAPAARHWKNQINLMAKGWGQCETLPEADYNLLAGSLNPENDLRHLMVLFLMAASNLPHNQLRVDLTRQHLMLAGIGTDFYRAVGQSALSQQWTAVHFGDYLGYYLAMAYGVDPAAVPAIESLANKLKEI